MLYDNEKRRENTNLVRGMSGLKKKDTSRKSIKKIIAKYYSDYNLHETDIKNADNGRRKRIVD